MTIFWICMLSTEASRIKAFIYIYIVVIELCRLCIN